MATKGTIGERWADYRPSKGVWFWSLAGACVATVLVGFTWGGWVTGGTASEMATQARQQLAAAVCVERFMSEPDARTQLIALQQESSWKRSDIISQGGWAKMPDDDAPPRAVYAACAERLARMELPAESAASEATTAIE